LSALPSPVVAQLPLSVPFGLGCRRATSGFVRRNSRLNRTSLEDHVSVVTPAGDVIVADPLRRPR